MSQHYLKRSLEPVVLRAAREFPSVLLTGPRQSGKTTLLKNVFGSQYRYVSLELPDARAVAAEDPRGFLAANPSPVIIDEIQHVPDLLPYIKDKIDNERDRTGQYILTGSQNLLLSERTSESLAGRVAVLRLLPLSNREIALRPDTPLAWERQNVSNPQADTEYLETWSNFLRGGYPELVTQPERDLHLWHSSYVQTYLERDVRTLRQIGDLTQFQNFLRVLAARSAQLLNITSISRDLGVAVNTIKAWVSVLEASYQIVVLRPYFANIGKRLVKTPKIYFSDVGTLCHLVGLKDPEHAAAGPMGGVILETAILSEVVRTLTHRGMEPQIYFWRTLAGTEVDFVVKTNAGLVPIEVKLSTTPRSSMASSIMTFHHDLAHETLPGYVVHPGSVQLALGNDTEALPYTAI